MGRAHEVRAKKMAKTNAAKSALCNRASKEVYMAAKSGIPDPKENLALRSAIEKFKGMSVPKDIIERAIQKAKGKDATDYKSSRYEAYGPGKVGIIIETLSDNDKRAFANVRSAVTHSGGNIGTTGSVSFMFEQLGVLVFKYEDVASLEETLILGEVDLKEILQLDSGYLRVTVDPKDLSKAKEVLKESFGLENFKLNEVRLVPNGELINLKEEDEEKFIDLMQELDECEDVQAVYHNASIDLDSDEEE